MPDVWVEEGNDFRPLFILKEVSIGKNYTCEIPDFLATPDECADSCINCNNGFIGIDISDIVNASRCGEQPPEYYASLSLEEILRSNELYASKKGIVLFIHAPTNANLEDVDTHCAQICDLCSEDAVVLWNILIDKEIHEYLFDVFVSGDCGETDLY